MEKRKGKIAAASERLSPRTLTELLGNHRLIVEHHNGIISYGPDQILIRASFGQLCLIGDGMLLRCMSRYQLCITGRIFAVELRGNE